MSSNPTDSTAVDASLRFLFDDADVRGEAVRLGQSYRNILDIHQYPPSVGRLLGEFLAASVLLASTLKFEGRLILQARSEAQVPLLMAECNNQLQVRAIARGAEQATADSFEQLLGGGQLAITIDPEKGQRYQGIVPLDQGSLGASLQTYFQQSEQLQTRFWLASDGEHAGGLLLQQLPEALVSDREQRQQQWDHALSLASTTASEELLQLPPQALLFRLFHEDPVRLFEPSSVEFRCSCSRERTLGALSSIGREEVEDLLDELGSITMDCEFCNQQYVFQREDLGEVLGEAGPGTLH